MDPDARKREILETAMRLFVERGYEAVSMRDIAKAADITAGLCYHYFDSKQKLFAVALAAYAEECCRDYLRILDDARLTLEEKIDALYDAVLDEESLRYHEFFHAEGNQELHRQLAFELCDLLGPHLLDAVEADARRRGMTVRSPETLVDFLTHGQLNVLSSVGAPDREDVERIRSYVHVLLASQTEPVA